MKNLLKIIIGVIFCTTTTLSFSTNVDSLLGIWHNTNVSDSVRIKSIKEVISFYSINSYENDSLLKEISKEVLQAGKDEKKPKFEAYGYNFSALSSNTIEEALPYLEKSHPIIIKYKMSDIAINVLMSLANFNKWSGNYYKAIKYYFELLNLKETDGKLELKSEINYQLAEIYLSQNDTTASIDKINEILKLEKTSGRP